MDSPGPNPTAVEILRYTLWRLERSSQSPTDDPALAALKRQIVGTIAELELARGAKLAECQFA